MKKLKSLLVVLVTMFFFVSTVEAAVTLRYHNKDSEKHTMTVKIAGSSKKVTFESSRTASVTIQGGSTSAEIETSCGKVEVKDGDTVEIKDGCIKIK